MINNNVNIEISEVLIEKNDVRGEKYGKIASECLEKLMRKVCINSRHRKTEINVILTDNEEIRIINKEHRNIDAPTDVLSFPLFDLKEGKGIVPEYGKNPENGCIMLGDIVVSVDKVDGQAAEFGHGTTRELAFLLCHGLLHLLGFDHMTPEEEKVMMSYAEKLLNEAGYERE